MANRYWVGNSGNYNDTAHWSTSSGGAGGASVPTPGDDVFFDANSFSANGHVVSIETSFTPGALDGGYCKDLNTVGATKTFTISLGDNRFIAPLGNILLNNKVTIQATGSGLSDTSGFIAPYGNASGLVFDQNGAALNAAISFQQYGTTPASWSLSSDITLGYQWDLNQLSGTLASNGHNITASVLSLFGGSSNWSTSDIFINIITAGASHTLSMSLADIFMNTSRGGLIPEIATNGHTLGDVMVENGPYVLLWNSSTINSLSLNPQVGITGKAGATWTFGELHVSGTSGLKAPIRSYTPGSRFTMHLSSGTFATNYLDIKDSAVTGGGGWYAGINSVDSGNNTGWTFNNIVYELSATTVVNGGGSGAITYDEATYDGYITIVNGGGIGSYITEYQPLSQKDYEYRVFTSDGVYVSTWASEVNSDFGYEQSINQTAGELIVSLARSPENRVVRLDALQDQTGSNILDQNSDVIYVQTESANAIGPGTDVQKNYNVDVYAFYGGYEPLLDQNSDIITDQNNDPILVQYGFPNGVRVYSGYIAKSRLKYGQNKGVSVTIVPRATGLYHHMFRDVLDNTTVSYGLTDPIQMARDAIDLYNTEGGVVTYTEESMPYSGEEAPYDFTLQRTKEVIDKVVDLLPAGYYHYPHPGENLQYILLKSETPHHTFYYERDITDFEIEESITQLINDVYFAGGVPDGSPDGTPALLKHYDDATSQTTLRRGLDIISDSRVTIDTSAQALSQNKINQYKDSQYVTQITISDAVYDIESINLGEMVGFGNFGSFVDDLVLQIVRVQRKKHSITLDLGMIIPGESKRLEEIKRSIISEQVRDIADAPS